MTLPKRLVQVAAAIAGIGLLMALSALISCAPTTTQLQRAQFPDAGGDGPGYRFKSLGDSKDDDKLFVCLTFSGGGTRAAALAYGAMLALRQARIDWPRQGETLLDEVDCISSVSGGSFTAAYYGLFRDDLFQRFEDQFLHRNIEGSLILRVLYPWNWLRLA